MAATSMGSKTFAMVAAALVCVASPALAAPTAAQRETARRLMDEGKERTRTGDKERAVEAYRKAHELMRVPTTGIALARAHLALGNLVEARDVALEVVRMPRDRGEPPVFEQSRKAARELEASVKPKIPTVKIVVKGGPATAVTVDDAEIAPLLLGEPVALNPGTHVIVAHNADGVARRAEVELAERDVKAIELDLPVATPTVVTASAPTPPPQSGSPPPPRMEPSTASNVLVYGGFGLAAAGLVVGTVAGAMTLGKAGEVKPLCDNGVCDPAAESDLGSARGLATVSTIAFVVAGGGVALGVVGLLLPKTTRESALYSDKKRLGLWLGPGSAGLRGSF